MMIDFLSSWHLTIHNKDTKSESNLIALKRLNESGVGIGEDRI